MDGSPTAGVPKAGAPPCLNRPHMAGGWKGEGRPPVHGPSEIVVLATSIELTLR